MSKPTRRLAGDAGGSSGPGSIPASQRADKSLVRGLVPSLRETKGLTKGMPIRLALGSLGFLAASAPAGLGWGPGQEGQTSGARHLSL